MATLLRVLLCALAFVSIATASPQPIRWIHLNEGNNHRVSIKISAIESYSVNTDGFTISTPTKEHAFALPLLKDIAPEQVAHALSNALARVCEWSASGELIDVERAVETSLKIGDEPHRAAAMLAHLLTSRMPIPAKS